MTKVYVIIIAHVEGTQIKHICASEETARKRWNEVRLELIPQRERMVEHYKGELRKYEVELLANFNNATFDTQELCETIHDHPVWFEMEVEQ